jgi:hypothetical protein
MAILPFMPIVTAIGLSLFTRNFLLVSFPVLFSDGPPCMHSHCQRLDHLYYLCTSVVLGQNVDRGRLGYDPHIHLPRKVRKQKACDRCLPPPNRPKRACALQETCLTPFFGVIGPGMPRLSYPLASSVSAYSSFARSSHSAVRARSLHSVALQAPLWYRLSVNRHK